MDCSFVGDHGFTSALGLLAACEDRQNMRYRGTRAFRPGSLFISLTRKELCDAVKQTETRRGQSSYRLPPGPNFWKKCPEKANEVGRKVATGDRTTAVFHFAWNYWAYERTSHRIGSPSPTRTTVLPLQFTIASPPHSPAPKSDIVIRESPYGCGASGANRLVEYS